MRSQDCNADGLEMSSVYVEHHPVDQNAGGPSLTRQEFADDCDINVILAQYERTGVINHYSSTTPEYLDLTEFPDDLQGSLLLMKEAEKAFMRLPAIVRKEFDNDAVQFVEFAHDPHNLPQMREWGLAEPAKPVQPPAPPPLPKEAPVPASPPKAS